MARNSSSTSHHLLPMFTCVFLPTLLPLPLHPHNCFPPSSIHLKSLSQLDTPPPSSTTLLSTLCVDWEGYTCIALKKYRLYTSTLCVGIGSCVGLQVILPAADPECALDLLHPERTAAVQYMQCQTWGFPRCCSLGRQSKATLIRHHNHTL